MIIGFRHKGLERFYRADDARGVNARHAPKLRRILTLLSRAKNHQGMNVPGFRLHAMKGERAGTWAVDVSGNWRVTFRFDGENVTAVDYEDYH